jgi:hypothetical protein
VSTVARRRDDLVLRGEQLERPLAYSFTAFRHCALICSEALMASLATRPASSTADTAWATPCFSIFSTSARAAVNRLVLSATSLSHSLPYCCICVKTVF